MCVCLHNSRLNTRTQHIPALQPGQSPPHGMQGGMAGQMGPGGVDKQVTIWH